MRPAKIAGRVPACQEESIMKRTTRRKLLGLLLAIMLVLFLLLAVFALYLGDINLLAATFDALALFGLLRVEL